MNRKDLWEALEQIDDDLLMEAAKPRRAMHSWKRWGALAACLVLMVTGIWVWERGRGVSNQADSSMPYFASAERTVSENETTSETVMEGENVMNNFAYMTGDELLSGEENGLYSPASLYYALGMTAAGAVGDTQTQLLKILNAESLDSLLERCLKARQGGGLKIAGSLWIDQALGEPAQSYAEQLERYFGAEVFSVDFGAPGTAERMGEWVSEQTEGLVVYTPSEDPGPLSLLNTVYYQSRWAEKFRETDTREDTFTRGDGQEIAVPFMNGVMAGQIYHGDGYVRGELSLEEGRMIFILPEESLDALMSGKGTRALFEEGEGDEAMIEWHIPKFSCDGTLQAAELLQQLGDGADFSGMTANGVNLLVSDVTQKTHIDVNEYGVEAAAYTEVAMKMSAVFAAEESLYLNRPFLYGLYDEAGNLLFMGVCENPAG